MPVRNTSALGRGHMEGAAYGATVSLIFDHSEPGKGPRLHRHPYDETWVVLDGTLTFQLGDERLSTGPGDIVIAPADPPHKFVNVGPGPANLVCIYASPTFRTCCPSSSRVGSCVPCPPLPGDSLLGPRSTYAARGGTADKAAVAAFPLSAAPSRLHLSHHARG